MKVAVCDDQEIFLKAVYNEVKSLSYLEISLFDDSTKLAEEIKNGEYYDLFINCFQKYLLVITNCYFHKSSKF